MIEPNREEFEKVCKELKYESLNLTHLGRIFGQPFWELIVLCLCDAREAAVILERLRKND